MQQPIKISVIMPAYNAAAFIGDAITSIQEQEYPDIEIVVIDDGSTDETVNICAQMNVTLIQQAHQGVAAARNMGIKSAKGELITFLDADDLWYRDKLKIQITQLENNPGTDIVIGTSQPVDKHATPYAKPFFIMLLGAAIMKRTVFDQVGLFDEKLEFGEDTDWFLRAMESNCVYTTSADVVLKYRRHDNNMTKDRTTANLFLLRTLKLSLDRRRKDNQSEASELPQMDLPEA